MTARTLVSGGPVLVLDGKTPAQQALVMENGRIVGVGAEDDMKGVAGPGARRLDLDGATAMPGLVDGHSHQLHLEGFPLGLVDILDARSHDDIIERIRERAKTTPPGEWIMTTPVGEAHYFVRRDYRDLAERHLPDRKVLDRATSAHPVLIQAWTPTTPNVTAFNSLGLERVGIGRVTPDKVSNVTIEKDADGRPTGILRGPVTFYYVDDPYWLQIIARLPQPNAATWATIWETAARLGMKAANRLGITAGYECHAMDLVHIQSWQKVRDANELTMRVMAVLEAVNWVFNPYADPTPDYVRSQLELAKSLTQTTDDLMRVNGTTIGRGGIVETGAFRTYEPYRDPFGNPTKGKTALPKWVEEMVVEYCCKNDLRLNIGAYSYVDHDEFFDSIAPYVEKYDIKSRDWVAQHCMVISEPQARRYRDLGFQLTQGSGFVWGMGDMFLERIGEHVLKDLSPMKRLVDLGINVSLCVDWGPPSVFHQMQLAETHQLARSGRKNLHPGHALSRDESLATFTRNPARLMQWKGIGSLLPDYHADITIVDRNPATCTLDDLAGTQVLRTIVGGNTVYDDGSLKG